MSINKTVEELVANLEAELRAEGFLDEEDEPEPPPRCEWCGVIETHPGHVWSGRGEVIDGEFCEECWRGPVWDLDHQLAREAQEERARRSK